MAEKKRALAPKAVPAMPVLYSAAIAKEGPAYEFDTKVHDDHVAPIATASSEWYALIHTPMNPKDAYRIPKAKKALQDSWDKLGKERKAWILESVMEREDVKKKYAKENKSVHFGYLRQLLFEKHSELPPEKRVYKGRVVFRGDQVKDERKLCCIHGTRRFSLTPSSCEASRCYCKNAWLCGGRL